MKKDQSRKRTTLETVLYIAAAITALYALFVYKLAMNGDERDMVRAVARKLRARAARG